MYDGQGSPHVGFASEPLYSRRPRSDEEFVMEHFHRHAKRCKDCYDPYSTYVKGGSLCDQGHRLAQDVAGYMYSKGGRAYSMLDRESLSQRVQVEIPPNCDRVRGLLRAVDHGLRVQLPEPVSSNDRSYHVPSRSKRRSYYPHESSPVQESRRRRGDESRFRDERRYRDAREDKNDPRYTSADKYRTREKRYSSPVEYDAYGSRRRQDVGDKSYRQSYYDGNPVYYYKPSKRGSERRIPRSESPRCESVRRVVTEEPRSSKYGYPSGSRSSKYEFPRAYRNSGYSSPDDYRSSRHSSPDSYRSTRRAQPEGYRLSRRSSPDTYSSRRSSWSPERLYRSFFR
jgi:hypothetical protein